MATQIRCSQTVLTISAVHIAPRVTHVFGAHFAEPNRRYVKKARNGVRMPKILTAWPVRRYPLRVTLEELIDQAESLAPSTVDRLAAAKIRQTAYADAEGSGLRFTETVIFIKA